MWHDGGGGCISHYSSSTILHFARELCVIQGDKCKQRLYTVPQYKKLFIQANQKLYI